MSKRRGVLLLCFFSALGIFAVTWGWRHFVLLPFGRVTDAAVLSVHQPPPWRIREADVDVTYAFVHDGQAFRGTDTVAPVRRPATGGKIRVRYWPRRPVVNRVAGEVTPTPIAGAFVALYGVYATARHTRWKA